VLISQKKQSTTMSEEVKETASTATNDKIAAKDPNLPTDFSLDNLKLQFEECLNDDNTISIEKYIFAYEELFKFLNLLGTVFGWVASDIDAKMEILRGLKNGEQSEKYLTVQSMIQYEVDNNLIKYKAKDSSTGTRNLLRLHRALEYIAAFLDGVPGLDDKDKCCSLSQEAYKKTLIKYHPWVVQKAALLAMHMLPTREGLIAIICEPADEEVVKKSAETLEKAVMAMKKVYDVTQEVYKEKDLLALP